MNNIIKTKKYTPEQVQKAYNRRSGLYNKFVAPSERKYHEKALDIAKIQPNEKVLEVAVGSGHTFLEISKLVGKNEIISGIDLSQKMLKLTQNKLEELNHSNFDLQVADSRKLPFENNTFDVIYNAYMLDLIALDEMPKILSEFQRVLKSNGRLVLLNMSKKNENQTTFREKLYKFLPMKVVLYFAGGCRPVLMKSLVEKQGFRNVYRE
jgi:demethylmenaquinone methyltransferase/2-methoxy-6-polyprenyl-1,4-benzoquinol methylase